MSFVTSFSSHTYNVFLFHIDQEFGWVITVCCYGNSQSLQQWLDMARTWEDKAYSYSEPKSPWKQPNGKRPILWVMLFLFIIVNGCVCTEYRQVKLFVEMYSFVHVCDFKCSLYTLCTIVWRSNIDQILQDNHFLLGYFCLELIPSHYLRIPSILWFCMHCQVHNFTRSFFQSPT